MIHKNSFASRKQLITTGMKASREQMIFQHLFYGRKKESARTILKALFPLSDDMNKVRPRLSDMEADGSVRVCGLETEGGLPVNVYECNWPAAEKFQQEMF